MQKIVSFVLLMILISPLESLLGAEELSNGQKERTLIIGYSGAPTSIDYWKKLRSSLFSRSKEIGVIAVDFTSHEFSLDAQRIELERAANMKLDGMIVGVVSDEVFPSIEAFRERNIPIIAVNSSISSDWPRAIITTDNEKAVKMAGNFILERLQSGGNNAKRIIILCGEKNNVVTRSRTKGPLRMLSEAGYDVHVYYSKGWHLKSSTQDAVAEFSQHGQDIAAVFSCFAEATIASALSAERYGWRPLLVGFDLDDKIRALIKDGRLDATVIQDPVRIGAASIEGMVKVLKGKMPVAQMIDIPARLVTRENVSDF